MGHTGHHWDYTEHMRNGVGHVLGHGGEQLDIMEIMCSLIFLRISWDATWPMGHGWDSVCGRVERHERDGRGAVEARA